MNKEKLIKILEVVQKATIPMMCIGATMMMYGLYTENKELRKRNLERFPRVIDVRGDPNKVEKFYDITCLDGTVERAYAKIDGIPIEEYIDRCTKGNLIKF